jgi:ADP-ribose pyrophosphatase YjhB (NUDIX family)
MQDSIICPHCGQPVEKYKNPIPTTDIIIDLNGGIVLIQRKNFPYGWAIPGGFIDYGETAGNAAQREAEEETSLKVTDLKLFNVYSSPDRDPRQHTISVVFTARAQGQPRAADDASDIGVFSEKNIPYPLAFDHAKILADYFGSLKRSDSPTD